MDHSSDNQILDSVVRHQEALEGRIRKLEVGYARADESINTVNGRLEEVRDTLKWLVRLILGAIILAFVAFVIQNGLIVESSSILPT